MSLKDFYEQVYYTVVLDCFYLLLSGATFAAPKGICTSDNGAFIAHLIFPAI